MAKDVSKLEKANKPHLYLIPSPSPLLIPPPPPPPPPKPGYSAHEKAVYAALSGNIKHVIWLL